MDRMAQHTKQPEVLRELFKALGDDPFVIAECLARPLLAERLVTAWNAFDERIHGDLRKRAEGELQADPTVEQMRFTSGTYSETEFVMSDNTKVNRGAGHAIELNSRNWNKTIQTLAETLNTTTRCCPTISSSADGNAKPNTGRRDSLLRDSSD